MAASSKELIEFDRVGKRFGRTLALRELSFSIAKGELVGFVGPNGAGKTTAIRLITGYHCADTGNVTIGGADARLDLAAVARQVGYLSEKAPAYPEMTVAGYLTFRYRLKAERVLDVAKEVARVCDLTQIDGFLGKRIGSLSRGYRQRVALAEALLCDPEILVLDEPMVGLDPVQTKNFRELLSPFRGKKTVIFSSHRLADVEKIADRLIFISGGRLIGDGTLDELRRRSKLPQEAAIEDVFVELVEAKTT